MIEMNWSCGKVLFVAKLMYTCSIATLSSLTTFTTPHPSTSHLLSSLTNSTPSHPSPTPPPLIPHQLHPLSSLTNSTPSHPLPTPPPLIPYQLHPLKATFRYPLLGIFFRHTDTNRRKITNCFSTTFCLDQPQCHSIIVNGAYYCL